jgi:hypothetical protein
MNAGDAGSNDRFTVKEIILEIQRDVLSLTGKIDGHIASHSAEQAIAITARSDPRATPAGLRLLSDLHDVAEAGRTTRGIVDRHEVLLQRVIGAGALFSILGGIGGIFAILRLGGVLGP